MADALHGVCATGMMSAREVMFTQRSESKGKHEEVEQVSERETRARDESVRQARPARQGKQRRHPRSKTGPMASKMLMHRGIYSSLIALSPLNCFAGALNLCDIIFQGFIVEPMSHGKITTLWKVLQKRSGFSNRAVTWIAHILRITHDEFFCSDKRLGHSCWQLLDVKLM